MSKIRKFLMKIKVDFEHMDEELWKNFMFFIFFMLVYML